MERVGSGGLAHGRCCAAMWHVCPAGVLAELAGRKIDAVRQTSNVDGPGQHSHKVRTDGSAGHGVGQSPSETGKLGRQSGGCAMGVGS